MLSNSQRQPSLNVITTNRSFPSLTGWIFSILPLIRSWVLSVKLFSTQNLTNLPGDTLGKSGEDVLKASYLPSLFSSLTVASPGLNRSNPMPSFLTKKFRPRSTVNSTIRSASFSPVNNELPSQATSRAYNKFWLSDAPHNVPSPHLNVPHLLPAIYNSRSSWS